MRVIPQGRRLSTVRDILQALSSPLARFVTSILCGRLPMRFISFQLSQEQMQQIPASMPNLRTLRFNCQTLPSSTTNQLLGWDALIHSEEWMFSSIASAPEAHRACSLIRSLDVQQLHTLMTRLPQLSNLMLTDMSHIHALTFLEPVHGTLRSLTLDHCGHNTGGLAEAVACLSSLSLTHLTLNSHATPGNGQINPNRQQMLLCCNPSPLPLPCCRRWSISSSTTR
jgi:hypothetical protein